MLLFTSLRSTRGFTFIEHLAIVLIVLIVATGAFTFFENAKQKIRDNQRISDLEVLVKALREYNLANDHYPYNGDPVMGTWSAVNFKAALSPYIATSWPNDPSADALNLAGVGGYKYVYCVAPVNGAVGQTYALAAHLERKNAMYLAGENIDTTSSTALVDIVSTAAEPAGCFGADVGSLIVS